MMIYGLDPHDPADPGYCGLDLSPGPDAETGMWDPYWIPACKPHDAAFNELKAGAPTQTNLETAAIFTANSISVAATGLGNVLSAPFQLLFGQATEDTPSDVAKGLYSIVALPVYLAIGGLGGIVRWAYLESQLSP